MSFTRRPKELPPDTFLTYRDSHMNTPMQRDGDVFVAEFEIEANARLDYAFTVTRTSDGEPVKLWKGAASTGAYFTTNLASANGKTVVAAKADDLPKNNDANLSDGLTGTATMSPGVQEKPSQAGASQPEEFVRVHSKVVRPPAMPFSSERMIQFEVQYRNPLAQEVTIIWGLNNYRTTPGKLPAGTFLTYRGSHMNTPMTRRDDLFVFEFEVQPDTQLHYQFLITRTSDGEPAKISRNDKSTGKEYTRILSVADADETVDPVSGVSPQKTSWTVGITIGVSALVVLWVAFGFRSKSVTDHGPDSDWS